MKTRNKFPLATFLCLTFLFPGIKAHEKPKAADLKTQVDMYKQRYNLKNPYDKLVDNRGNGFENLYGVRNFRVVLHGIYYRGGANNLYNIYDPKENSNPLPRMGLENLCQEGFQETVYYYTKNFEKAEKNLGCKNFLNQSANIKYEQLSVLTTKDISPILKKIYERIKNPENGPLYGHCWNGWHASGFMAAVSLKQFCDWSDDQAEEYWIRNTDGDSNYPSVKKKLRNFKPQPEYQISEYEKSLICP